MNRRTLLKALGLPALAATGALGWMNAARAKNRYYEGPVSDHFDGVRFFSPGQPQDKGFLELARWQLGGGRKDWPDSFPSPFRDKPPAEVQGLRTALIGHASFLIQVAGLNILTDPVFSERASPVSFAGPKRVNPPGIAFEDLPPIHAVLITHNHYDHLDARDAWDALAAHRPSIVAPLGNDAIIRAEHPDIAVETRDWGGSVDLGRGVTAHLRARLSLVGAGHQRPAHGAVVRLCAHHAGGHDLPRRRYRLRRRQDFSCHARALRHSRASRICPSAPMSRAGSWSRST